jgi:hypothetical protein
MAYVITVKQMVQLQVIENGAVKAKSLLPDRKYVINNVNSKQIIDLKKVSLIKLRSASVKDESCCENLNVK